MTSINPVTIRGKESNLSIGRLWIATDKVPDTSYKFDPQKPTPVWNKPVTLVIWQEHNMEGAVGVVINEPDFVKCVHKLRETNAEVSLDGSESYQGKEKHDVSFNRDDNELKVKFKEKEAILDFSKFNTGLGYLFTNGEI